MCFGSECHCPSSFWTLHCLVFGIQLSDNRVAQFDEYDVLPLRMNKLLEKKCLKVVRNAISTPLSFLIPVRMLLSISLKKTT